MDVSNADYVLWVAAGGHRGSYRGLIHMPIESTGPRSQGDWQGRLDSLLEHVLGLESEVNQIRQDLERLRSEANLQSLQQVLDRQAVPVPPPPPLPPQMPPAVRQPVTPAAIPPTAPAVKTPVKPSPAPSSNGIGELEAWIGGAWLSWAAGLFLMLGMIWFFWYAVEQGWISPWLRVGTGWTLGLLLLGLGEGTTRRQLPWFASGVTGAGIGLGYIAGYAASPLLYDLIPLTGSYAVLSVITAIGLVQAVRLNQISTAILALLGGFLTLVLLKSPHPTAAGLLGYLLALGIGALGAGQLRRWPALRYLAWAGTALMISLWLTTTHARGQELAAALPLLSLLFAMYQLDILLWRFRVPDERSTPSSQLAGLNGIGFLMAIYFAVTEDQVALFAGTAFFAVAAFQIALGRLLWTRRDSEQNRRVAISLYAQGSLAAALGLPVAFDRFLIVLGWSAQAVITAWLVRHVRSVWLRLGIAGLLAASILYMLGYYREPFLLEGPTLLGLLVPGRTWLSVVVALAGGACAYLLARDYGRSQWRLDRAIAEICALLASLAAIIAAATLLLEVPRRYTYTVLGILGKMDTYAWMGVFAAACLGVLAYRAKYLRLAYVMGVVLLGTAMRVAIDSADGGVFWEQPWQWGAVTFGPLLTVGLPLIALGLWNAWLTRYARTRDANGPALAELVLAIAGLGLLVVLYRQIADDSPSYAVLAATVGTVVLALLGRAWREPAYGPLSAVIWVVAAGYWIFAATIGERFTASGRLDPDWLAVTPFANSTFLAALALIAVAWLVIRSLQRSAAMQQQGTAVYAAVPAMLAAYLVLHACSFEVDRWCQIHGPGRFADPAHAERVALSVLWALLALAYVVAGLVFAVRGLRLMGLLLFAITAGKVLLVDMAHVAVLYRVFSAMGLGILSLVGSYAYQRVRRRALQKQVASAPGVSAQPEPEAKEP
jgi:uncharacterized membrane protein